MLQDATLRVMLKYQDLIYSARSVDNYQKLREAYVLHCVNHVHIARTRLRAHDEELKKTHGATEFRDQGFTQPTVLIMLPTRNDCFNVVNTLISYSCTEQHHNKARLKESFSINEDEETLDKRKPADFIAQFSGNTDDFFCLGIKFIGKSLKLFGSFYSCDVILASPLGLKVAIEKGQTDRQIPDHVPRKNDKDFLSSIEILVVDDFVGLQMQNLNHLHTVIESLNSIPKDPHGCDFSRIRDWYLDEKAAKFRQTIILTSALSAEVNSIWRGVANWHGKCKSHINYQSIIPKIGISIKQTYQLIGPSTPTSDPDVRFKAFTHVLLPQIRGAVSRGITTLLYIPSYYDFVHIRNHLDSLASPFAFGHISEYTPIPEVSRVRSFVKTGKFHFVLLTERAYWFFRPPAIKGISRIIFYQLPQVDTFLLELARWCTTIAVAPIDINMDDAVKSASHSGPTRIQPEILALFSRWDFFRLERILGSDQARTMCHVDQSSDIWEFE